MALNATTPQANYSAVSIAEDSGITSMVVNGNDSDVEFTKETFASLKKYVLEGDVNLKTTGLVAGGGIMICGTISCAAHIFDMDIPNVLLDILILCIGYVCR